MNVKADSTRLAYHSVSVLLSDSSGKTLEVLFHGPLTDIGRLSRLEAGEYQGVGFPVPVGPSRSHRPLPG